jgi:hypothetical protein
LGAFDGALERAGTIAIPYTLFDTAADPVSITAEFSTDGGASFAAAGTSVSQRTSLLSSDPSDPEAPFAHTYVWESALDEGTRRFQGAVLLRFRPFDLFGAGEAETLAARVDNNVPPSSVIVTPPRAVSGELPLEVILTDVEADPARVAITFEATIQASGAVRTGSATILRVDGQGGLAGAALAASPEGAPHTLVWGFGGDLGTLGTAVVRLRALATDASGDAGPTGISAPFVVGNEPPLATAGPLQAVEAGNVSVPYALVDTAGDLGAIEVQFGLAGGPVLGTATAASGTPLANLPTTGPGPGGSAELVFVWDSARDLPARDVQVFLEIAPRDAFTAGAPTRTAAFRLDNLPEASAPSLDLASTTLSRAQLEDGRLPPLGPNPSASEIAISYALVDASGALLDLDVDWRLDLPGAATRPATVVPVRDGKTGLASSPSGVPHVFVWAAAADLAAVPTSPALVEEDVVLRFTPRRPPLPGLAESTGAPREVRLRAGNRPPKPRFLRPGGTGTRVVVTDFAVSDTSADAITVSLTAERADAPGAAVTVDNLLVQKGFATVIQPAIPGVETPGGVVWNSVRAADRDVPSDTVFGFLDVVVNLTLTARDRFGLTDLVRDRITLDNDLPPQAHLLSVGFPGRPLRGRVPIAVALSDPEANLSPQSRTGGFLVRYSTDNGASFVTATGLVLGAGAKDFATLTGGRPFLRAIGDTSTLLPEETATFLWDTIADVGLTPAAGTPVVIQVIPRNSLAGTPAFAFGKIENTVALERIDQVAGDGTDLSLGFFPMDLLPVDLGGDGVTDIVAATANLGLETSDANGQVGQLGPGEVHMLRQVVDSLGRPTGAFQAAATAVTSGGEVAVALASADFDGDGLADVAVANAGGTGGNTTVGAKDASVRVLRGLASAPFLSLVPDVPYTGTRTGATNDFFHPIAIAALDLTGDGLPDLAVFDRVLARIRILAGRGDLSFEEVDQVPSTPSEVDPILPSVTQLDATGAPGPVRIAAGDVTGDGVPDLIATSVGRLVLFRGLGEGLFGAEELIRSIGNGLFGAFALAVTDVDGDGIADIFVRAAHFGSDLLLLRGTGGGAFIAVDQGGLFIQQPYSAVAFADVTGDGALDIVAPRYFGTAVDLLAQRRESDGRGSGRFDPVASLEVGNAPFDIVAADLDGDGHTELAVPLVSGPRREGTLTVFRTGDGARIDLASTPEPVTVPKSVEPADFDRDGLDDLLVDVFGVANLDVAFARRDKRDNGTGALVQADADLDRPVRGLFQTVNVKVSRAADFDGDGALDVAVMNFTDVNVVPNVTTGTVDVLVGNLPLAPSPGAVPDSVDFDFADRVFGGTSGVGIDVMDLDGDGAPDFAVSMGSGVADSAVEVFRQSTSAGGVPLVAFSRKDRVGNAEAGLHFPFGLTFGDFTQDGIPDIAVGCIRERPTGVEPGTMNILRGRGDGTFAAASQVETASSPAYPTVVDLNEDGIPDLVFQNTSTVGIHVLRGRGDGTFDRVHVVRMGLTGDYVIPLDLTGDGVPELCANLFNGNVLHVFRRIEPRGPAARGTPGGGRAPPRYGLFSVVPATRPRGVASLDLFPDGTPDLVSSDESVSVLRAFAATEIKASRPLGPCLLPGAQVPAEVAAETLRAIDAPSLDPAAAPIGDLPTPTAGMRLAPASRALRALPDTTTVSASVCLPLFAQLTGRELRGEGGRIRVYRHDRASAAPILPAYRRPPVGRLVEVATTAPGGGASVDAAAGTISFATGRLGTFQAFIEAPTGTVTLLRETFDGIAAPKGCCAPLPEGWRARGGFAVAAPDLAGAPTPTSAPFALLANPGAAGVRANAADDVTTPEIVIGLQPGAEVGLGWRVSVRYDEHLALAGDAADAARVEVVDAFDASGAALALPPPLREVSGPQAGGAFAPVALVDIALPAGTARFKLRFTIETGGASASARLWAVDDLDVTLEKE